MEPYQIAALIVIGVMSLITFVAYKKLKKALKIETER